MNRWHWLPRQSLLLLIASALILPAVVAIAVGFATAQTERRQQMESEALATARQMVEVADAEVSADLRILHIMGYSQAISTRDWSAMKSFADVALDANPSWKALVIRDARTGEVFVDVGRGQQAGNLRPLPGTVPDHGLAEGSFRSGRHCPCVILHRAPARNAGLVLTLFADPAKFQGILMDRIKPDTVAAMVDGKGWFIARSLDIDKRVGTPATIYVRNAVRQGGEGLYEGRTFEGFDNYSAYTTSRLTGWSSHVAIARNWIDGPQIRSAWGIVIALMAALLLAMALLIYAAHDARRRRMEEDKFLKLQKSEVIAQFTSIVVHDMRNLLAASSAGLTLIEKHTAEDRTRQNVDRVRDVVRRGEKLINRLLSFARSGSEEIERVDLLQVFNETEDLLRQILGPDISFSWSIAPDARYVRANSDQLELALINLAKNARDAMEGKGAFSIDAVRTGQMVQILVDDNGPGVPPEIADHAFEAFVTTKVSGAGTGLGLAQVAGTVRQAGGHISVDKSPAGGARFKIFLPVEP